MLGREELCLKVLGLKLLDHMVVLADEVRIMVNTTSSPMLLLLVPIAQVDHAFLYMVLASPKWDQACVVVFLTLFQGK